MSFNNLTPQKVTLDIYQNKYVSVNVAQYDTNSREINIQISENGKPYIIDSSKITVRLKYRKADGKSGLYDCEILSDGTVKVEYTDQMTIVGGRSDSELMLIDTETEAVLHTMHLITNVIASSVPDGEIESSSEFTALENALTKIDTFNFQIDEYVKAAEVATETINEYQEEALATKGIIESYVESVETIEQEAIKYAQNIALTENEIANTKSTIDLQAQEVGVARDNAVLYEAEAKVARDSAVESQQEASSASTTINDYISTAQASVNRIDEVADTYENAVTEILSNEEERVQAEELRVTAENERKQANATALQELSDTNAQAQTAITEAENATLSANEATTNANKATQEANTLIEEMKVLIDNENIVHSEELGVAGGVATLDENGYIPSSQLPGFVDDVLDGKYDETNDQFLDLDGNKYTPEGGKIYVDVDTRKTYRWSGSTYVVIGSSLEIGTIEGTAFSGSRGLANENRIQALEEYHNNIPASDIKFDNSNTDLLSANVQGVIEEIVEDLSDLEDKAHAHNNQTVLNEITSAKVSTWDTVSDKVDKVDGKGLSTNDYTNEEKTQVATNKSDISSLKSDVEDLQHALVTTTSTTLNNSKAGGYKLLSMSGNSVQNGTPTPDAPQSIHNVGDCAEMMQGTLSSSNGEWVTSTTRICSKRYIPCVGGDTIRIKTETSKDLLLVAFYSDSSFISVSNYASVSEASFSAPTNATRFRIVVGDNNGITPSTVGKISLTINGKYVLQIKMDLGVEMIQGKYDQTNGQWAATNNVVCSKDSFPCNKGDVVKLETEGTATLLIYLYGENGYISYESKSNTNSIACTVPSGAANFKFAINKSGGVTPLTVGDLKLTINGVGETVATVLLNEPLRESDVMSRTEVVRNRATVVFDGSDDEGWYVSACITSSGVYRAYCPLPQPMVATENSAIANILCDNYTPVPANATYYLTQGISAIKTGAGIYIYDENYNTSDVTLWTSHLASNPITVEYELAEEVIETLDTDSQIALNSPETFDTVTYINVDSRVQPSEIKGEYGTTETSALAIKACNEACSAEIVANNNSGSGGSNYTFVEGNNVTITENGEEITISAKDTTYGVATSSTLGLVKSGTDITVDSSGNVTVNDDSHSHTIANVDGLQTALDGKADSSHGTHVTYSTTAPLVAGTASVGSATTVSRSDHVHPAQTTISGNAGSATKLATARTVRVDLGSEASASFDGTAAIAPGVTGILPATHGGTGKSVLSDVETSCEFIVGTQTAATGSWTGVTKSSTLYDGKQIVYWLPYAGSGNATLNLTLSGGTTTGAIPCYYSGANRLTTHYAAGNAIRLIYRVNANVNGTNYTGWWADANYADGNIYERLRLYANVYASSAIVTGNIIVGNSSGYFNLKTGGSFDITYPILYAGSSISASASGTNNYLAFYFTITTTQSVTLTAYKPVFIKGSLTGTTFTPISTTPLTQTVPTTADGYEYMLLGYAYTTTYMYLLPDHPIFAYKGGAFGQISSKGITDLSASGKTITYTRGDGTTGTITTQDTTYSVATTSANGLMSSTDKSKLDNIDTTIQNAIAEIAIVAVDENNDGNVVLNAYTVSSLTSAEGVAF